MHARNLDENPEIPSIQIFLSPQTEANKNAEERAEFYACARILANTHRAKACQFSHDDIGQDKM